MRAHEQAQVALRARRPEEAWHVYREALNAVPQHVPTAMNLALLSYDLGRLDEALRAIDLALQVESENPLIHTWRGLVLDGMWRLDEAVAAFRDALRNVRGAEPPFLVNARFGKCIGQFRVVYPDEADMLACRRRFEEELEELCTHYRAASAEERGRAIRELGTRTMFFLPYQGQMDLPLQRKAGELMCELMGACLPHFTAPRAMPKVPPGERIRVGFASAHISRHSVWKNPLGGWLTQLNRSKFEVFVYDIAGAPLDECTRMAEASCHHFVRGPLPVDRWATRIASDDLHVLIYPEIGMHMNVWRLAGLRLAPVQCTALGHPQTTGMPTIDYMLSSDLMEPADAQEHYSEKLVRLPNLSAYYEPLDDLPNMAATRQALGLREGATLFFSCQLTSKYLPQHDDLYARIAQRVPNSQIVFVDQTRSDRAARVFRDRMKRAFDERGLSFEEQCVIIPTLSPPGFAAATRLMDVALDSVGWSGWNSTLEVLAAGIPVVTWPGNTVRARHSAAILTRMGVTETIAGSGDEFVETAVRLGSDAAWRGEISKKVSENVGKCYRDRECVDALEAFIERCARGET